MQTSRFSLIFSMLFFLLAGCAEEKQNSPKGQIGKEEFVVAIDVGHTRDRKTHRLGAAYSG